MLTGTTPWTGRTETELKAKMKTIAIRNILPKTALQIKQDKEYMSAIQKRMISKQLLSQVHFCRFLYKLIANIEAGISY